MNGHSYIPGWWLALASASRADRADRASLTSRQAR